MRRSTTQHEEYWRTRKIDWIQSYLMGVDEYSKKPMWNHPHRDLIVENLKKWAWRSLMELGCASGANLVRIYKDFQGTGHELGGCDINPEAIEAAKKVLPMFKNYIECRAIDDLMVSDGGVDVVLTDMTLIYIGRDKIDKVMSEIKRVARKYVIFVEFHHDSLFKRLGLKYRSGYNAYDYRQLLNKYGFYDILISKMPETAWPGGDPQRTFGYIITARKSTWN